MNQHAADGLFQPKRTAYQAIDATQNIQIHDTPRVTARDGIINDQVTFMQPQETLPTLPSKASLHCEVLKMEYSPDDLPRMTSTHPPYGIAASNVQLGIAS